MCIFAQYVQLLTRMCLTSHPHFHLIFRFISGLNNQGILNLSYPLSEQVLRSLLPSEILLHILLKAIIGTRKRARPFLTSSECQALHW